MRSLFPPFPPRFLMHLPCANSEVVLTEGDENGAIEGGFWEGALSLYFGGW